MAEEPPITLTIDVANLTIGATMDLEALTQSQSVTAMCTWLVDHAGATMDELRPLKLTELATLFQTITRQVKTGVTPSKTNGARSSSPSRGAQGPRRSGRPS